MLAGAVPGPVGPSAPPEPGIAEQVLGQRGSVKHLQQRSGCSCVVRRP